VTNRKLMPIRHLYKKTSKNLYFEKKTVTSKAIPVAGLGDLYGCEMLRVPHCLDNWLADGGKVVNLTHRSHFIPQKHYFSASGTHFC
jgi:hypothetical protein